MSYLSTGGDNGRRLWTFGNSVKGTIRRKRLEQIPVVT